MKVEHVLLLAEFSEPQIEPTPALWFSNGKTLLAWQIERMRKLGYEITMVIGKNGDDLMRVDPHLEGNNLVFDPSSSLSLTANLVAGVQALDSAALIVPVNTPFPTKEFISRLEQPFWSNPFRDQVDVVVPKSNDSVLFPWIISRTGVSRVRKMQIHATEGPIAPSSELLSRLHIQEVVIPASTSTQALNNIEDYQNLAHLPELDF